MTAPEVYFEVPDFGYGPACGFLDVTSRVAEHYSWSVLTSGNAARFIARQRPRATLHDFDGFNPANWSRLPAIVPKGAMVLSMSNPRFAAWAAANGYRTGLVDQLDWMWETEPDGISRLNVHLVQHYFGVCAPRDRSRRRAIEIQPIVSHYFRRNRLSPVRDGTLLAFGGMAVAGRPEASDAYACWVLESVLPEIVEADAGPVYLVGGSDRLQSLASRYSSSRCQITCHVGASRLDYAQLLMGTRHQIVTPGLASIYECWAAGLAPMFQPGVNKSMVLQLDSVMTIGYEWIARWAWHSETVRQIAGMPQEDALAVVGERIAESLTPDSESAASFRLAAANYVRDDGRRTLELPSMPNLPDGATVLSATLNELL